MRLSFSDGGDPPPCRAKRHPVPYHADLDTPLLTFGNESWRIRDACEATAIFGAPGSGKTSASGAALLTAYLAAGMGGIRTYVRH